jgi:hypothetical protein
MNPRGIPISVILYIKSSLQTLQSRPEGPSVARPDREVGNGDEDKKSAGGATLIRFLKSIS